MSGAAANETRGGEMPGRIRTAGVRPGAAAKLKMPSPEGCGLPCREAVGADRPPAVPPPRRALRQGNRRRGRKDGRRKAVPVPAQVQSLCGALCATGKAVRLFPAPADATRRGVLSAVPLSRRRRKGAAEACVGGLFGPCAAACAVCRTAAAPFGEAGRNAGLFAARFSEEGGAFAARRLWNAKWHQESICSPRSAAPSSFWRSSSV